MQMEINIRCIIHFYISSYLYTMLYPEETPYTTITYAGSWFRMI
jgi:hypothetical protein